LFILFVIPQVLQQEIQAFLDSHTSYHYEENSMGFNNSRSSNERHIRFSSSGSDKIIFPTEKPSEPEMNYTPELAPDCYNSTFCEYVPNYPKEYVKHTIKNMEDLKYLSFVDEGVRIEKCVNENTSCKLIEGFAEGYVTSCKQKFIYRQLAAIRTNGTVGPDWFSFPSSCCCHVKFIGHPL
ncbi:hypothetical protein G9C98_002245, partial [Cotesia typhae]